MTSPPVRLPEYEGPLDVLVDLARRRQISLLDLPLAQLTEDYLSWIEQTLDLDLAVGAEFVDLAATLIRWKSQALLPGSSVAAERTRGELIRRLMRHEEARAAASLLSQRLLEESAVASRSVAPALVSETPSGRLTLFELIQMFEELAAFAAAEAEIDVTGDENTVADLLLWLKDVLSDGQRWDGLSLLRSQATPTRRVNLFLAMLEAAREWVVMETVPEGEGFLIGARYAHPETASRQGML